MSEINKTVVHSTFCSVIDRTVIHVPQINDPASHISRINDPIVKR